MRLAWRDLRGGLRGFGVFIACLALGVMTIAAVASASRGLTEGLAREGRRILGGDAAFSLIHREATPAERAFLSARGLIVRYVAGYGLPNHLRITIGLEEHNRALVEALQDFMKGEPA